MGHCNNFKHNNNEQFEEYKRVKEYFNDKPRSYYDGYCRKFVKNNVNNLWVERIKRLHKDKSRVTKYRLFLLHGKENYLKIFQEYCNKQSIKNTFEYKQNKLGWTKEQFDKFNQSRAVTLNNMIRRYGEEEGTKRFNNYKNKQSYVGCKLEYFIEKYGEEEGTKKFNQINKQKGMTLDNFIRKYGEEEGSKKFQEYIQKKEYSSSHLADNLFDELYNELNEEDKKHLYYLKLNGEFGKYDKEFKRYYKYDFVLTNKKICIEFNGDYWHANPKLYKPYDIIKLKGGNKKAADIWLKDLRKKEIIELDGYKVYYIWEIDYRETPKLVKERILNEIRNS